MSAGGMAMRAAVLAALRGDAALMAQANAVFDGPQGQASAPFVRIEEGVASDWGGKGLEGAELRLTLSLVDAAETPERLAVMVGRVEAAVRVADASAAGWRIVTAVMTRSRTGRGKDGRWVANIDYRLRGVRKV